VVQAEGFAGIVQRNSGGPAFFIMKSSMVASAAYLPSRIGSMALRFVLIVIASGPD
jgi:hypothetical protein